MRLIASAGRYHGSCHDPIRSLRRIARKLTIIVSVHDSEAVTAEVDETAMVQDNDETAIRSDNGLAFQMVETVRNARASNRLAPGAAVPVRAAR